MPIQEGWQGWDDYARFYDWENAHTVGRRDVAFWQELASRVEGRILELGCGTGRLSLPLLKHGARLVGIDRSEPMLARARARTRRARVAGSFVRGDIRHLPFRPRSGFRLVMAPYGMLQSLVRPRDLHATIDAVACVLPRGGRFVVDLVPDLVRWPEYSRRTTLSGRAGVSRHLTLVETVRQDRERRLTIFDQEYVERRGRSRNVHRFSLVFRTVSVPEMSARLERAGFRVDALLGDYRGGPWRPEADVWVVVARKK